jgi:chromate transporter
LFLGAALAAVLVTWFTFLPSFLFILAGGPLVESTHGKLHFTAPLIAITAAVVGVIASLALFFLSHIALKVQAAGLTFSNLDFAALTLTLAATVALLRFKQGVMTVLAASALLGLVVRLLGWG